MLDHVSTANRLAAAFANLDVAGRLRLLRAEIPGRIVFTTSFGLEDQVLTHLIRAEKLDITIATLDTGRLFPETYDLWEETEQRYDVTIGAYYPDASDLETMLREQSINSFYRSLDARKNCCAQRKVKPLARALTGASGWITGIRADQSGNRSTVSFANHDAAHAVIKLNPLLDWTRDAALAFADAHAVPRNALHAKGFLSIGCAPCTRALEPGEPERAGRWWWEEETKKECGLHVSPDGQLTRANAEHQA